MKKGGVVRGLLLFLVGVLVGANAVYFLMTRSEACDCGAPTGDVVGVSVAPAPTEGVAVVPPPGQAPAGSTPVEAPVESTPLDSDAPARVPAPAASPRDAAGGLLVPVQGIAPSELADTYDDPRGSDRMHEALDIMAPAGTPVLATADGVIEKLYDSDNGGLTIYQFDPTEQWSYYYAHLQGYAPGLAEGDHVERGEVIGYVGSTGNASAAAPHLHFGVYLLGDDKRWWRGKPVNPYPLLRPDGKPSE